MSSLPPTCSYRIVLFQSGLGDDGQSINGLINGLVSSNSLFKKYVPVLDLSHFDPVSCDFCVNTENGAVHSNEYEQQFLLSINNLVSYAHTFFDKVVLVRTRLNVIFGKSYDCVYDTIQNQSKKLNAIIDALKIHSGIRLFLVGHSQGGLVNLESAITKQLKIEKIISISTPYAPARVGINFLCWEHIFALFKKSMVSALVSEEYRNYVLQSLYTLVSNEYFSDLLGRWNATSYRPPLAVITGTSGLLTENYVNAYGVPTLTMHIPFDGLVCIGEQRAISYATYYDLINPNAPCCSNDGFLAQGCCHAVRNSIFTIGCNQFNNCVFSTISIDSTFIGALFQMAFDVISGNTTLDETSFQNHPFFSAVNEGLTKYNYTGTSDYENAYNIAFDAYNHLHILTNDETIEIVASLLLL